jgi:hypothetical protein
MAPATILQKTQFSSDIRIPSGVDVLSLNLLPANGLD